MTTSTPEASRRGEGGFWTVFGTATLPTGASGASSRGEEPPDQRQTGLCSMQRPVILSPGLPPDLPDGFIRLPYRPSDRPALPTALPEALAGRVTWVIHTAHLTDGFRQPDFPTARPNASSTSRPACLTDSPTGSLTGQPHQPATPASPTSQPDRPARPANPTGQPNRPARPSDRPALPAGFVPAARQHPHPPSTPAKVPPAGLTGRLRSAGRRLRGWRSSRHG